mgnify:CR=1 FL=1
MSFIIEIKNHDLQLLFNQENEVFNFVLDHFITKIITINNIIINNQLFGNLLYDLNDIIIKKFNNFGSYKNDIILFSFDNFNFYYEKSKKEIKIDNEKIITLINLFKNYYISNYDYQNDTRLIDELQNNQDSFNEELDYSNQEIESQQELIKKLNKKKELLEEINNKFKIDYDLYFKIKSDFKEIPDIFKFKYEVFSEIENNGYINDKNKAKKYYTENYNRINKNIGSTIFSKIFNQKEKEENSL